MLFNLIARLLYILLFLPQIVLLAHLSLAKTGEEQGIGPNGPLWYMINAVPAMQEKDYVNSNLVMRIIHQHLSSVVLKKAMIPASQACQTIGLVNMPLGKVIAARLYLTVILVFLDSCTTSV